MTRALALLTALALTACSPPTSPAASVAPHGARPVTDGNLSGFGPGEGPRGPSSVTVESLIDAATTYVCPEVDERQPNCRVPR